jgi:hypothetical protein
MSKKNELEKLMSQRSPLHQRQIIKPAKLYEPTPPSPQTREAASGQGDKAESPQGSESANPQTDKAARQQGGKDAGGQVVRYTTRLRPELIKWIKQQALDTNRKDYDVVLAAVEEYRARAVGKETS